MTGVGLIAHRNAALRVATVVTIEIRGASGEAIIRRTIDVDSRWARYGLEYCPLSATFHEVISDLVVPMHKEFDWQWDIAR